MQTMRTLRIAAGAVVLASVIGVGPAESQEPPPDRDRCPPGTVGSNPWAGTPTEEGECTCVGSDEIVGEIDADGNFHPGAYLDGDGDCSTPLPGAEPDPPAEVRTAAQPSPVVVAPVVAAQVAPSNPGSVLRRTG